ncbi:MAG: hypothetical protein J4O03_05755 [Chloroflexi bacterium]|nr:hypothetical protein [Chloroflexota bacterium]MCI0780930.1 hypothetical protein [Chloroflexota bacterium]MCI0786291.1 hypothetical protein [Chloroflexota bacterium]MCI0792957.1 hypothetical protein [Chloroflexota bacterium]MCI0797474.1 hypothetical protein [Chloroflexota bacterium]
MATQREEGAIPDFLVMEGPKGEGWNAGHSGQGDWNGWPSKDLKAATLVDEEGRVRRVRAPVTELEGLITPTELHYVVQHPGAGRGPSRKMGSKCVWRGKAPTGP